MVQTGGVETHIACGALCTCASIVVAYIQIDTIRLNTTLVTTTARLYRVLYEIQQAGGELILSHKRPMHVTLHHTE